MPWVGENNGPPLPVCWPSHCTWEVLTQGLRAFFEQIPLVCVKPFLTSARLSTQTKALTSPETIWITSSCGPSLLLPLLPSPGVTRLPNFFGTVPARDHSTSWWMLPAVCLLLHLYPRSDFKCPGLSWIRSVNSPLWERREQLHYSHWPSCRGSWGLCCGAWWDPPIGHKISLPSDFKHPLQMSFCFQTSYQLEFCWLFILFLRRSARRSSWMHKQVGSAPTYLTAIFQNLAIYYMVVNCLDLLALCFSFPIPLAKEFS